MENQAYFISAFMEVESIDTRHAPGTARDLRHSKNFFATREKAVEVLQKIKMVLADANQE